MNYFKVILSRWIGPSLPYVYLTLSNEEKKMGLSRKMWLLLLRWFLHPIKRRLAKWYVFILQTCFKLTVIGITGSSGKTTTKEMLASVLSKKGKTVITKENIDPVYNIPTTILNCPINTKYLILEMGVEHPGEMDYYLWLVRPSIGAITNIYPTHTQYFGNISGVLKEKIKLIKAIDNIGFVVLNGEDNLLRGVPTKLKAPTIFFKDQSLRAENIKVGESGTDFRLISGKEKKDIKLPLIGSQFVENALCATALGNACGLSINQIKEGLESFNLPKHRMTLVRIGKSLILDDSYNNNPVAAKAALSTLCEIAKGKKMAVIFGDMLELGQLEEKFHRELGRIMSRMPLLFLLGYGKASRLLIEEASRFLSKKRCLWFSKKDQIIKFVKPYLNDEIVILIKGSHSIGLDEIIPQLL
jgi:UDP-N-acetylmuramoyl-tripeptide--D-alanyl-D-alanine ligase